MLLSSPSALTHPMLTFYSLLQHSCTLLCRVPSKLLQRPLRRGSKVCLQQTTASVEGGSPCGGQWLHEEVRPWSDAATTRQSSYLYVKYKLYMMMRRCQYGTAPQYLTGHYTYQFPKVHHHHIFVRLPVINRQLRHMSGSRIWVVWNRCRRSVDVAHFLNLWVPIISLSR